MGGVLFIVPFLVASALFGDLANPGSLSAILSVLLLALVGICDDLIKLRTSRRGLTIRQKLLLQSFAVMPSTILLTNSQSAGWPSVVAIWLCLLFFSNAVNLTDGLDGLATGCLLIFLLGAGFLIAQSAMHVTSLSEQNKSLALLIPCGGMAGGLLAFLRFNFHPARIFMGNTGALAVGGLVGVVVAQLGISCLAILLAGVFVMEAVSVILQVASFRIWGRRIFRCAPLHHHFELAGHGETQVVRGLWCAAALFTIVALLASGFFPGRVREISGEPDSGTISTSISEI